MTDKVKKIRKEVERLQNELIQEKKKGFGSDIDDACILELQNVLTYIDSLQEEPVSEELEEVVHQYYKPNETFMDGFKKGANWQKTKIMANTADATIGLPYENKDGGYTHLVDVSRPLPIGDNKIAIIFKEG